MIEHSDLAGKRILVTGGTTGIGRATVALLVREGARVLTFGRDPQALDQSLAEAGGALGLTAGAATREGIEQVFEAVDRQLGGIDILVACAAIGAQPLDEMEDEDWRYVIDTNLAPAPLRGREREGNSVTIFEVAPDGRLQPLARVPVPKPAFVFSS